MQAQGIELEWHARDAASRGKVCQFLTAPFVGPFGCGTGAFVRGIRGVCWVEFRTSLAQDATIQGLEPPNPTVALDWATQARDWQVRITLDRKALQLDALADPLFWYVGFHDATNTEIYREDAQREELQGLLSGQRGEIIIERQFRSTRQPTTWTVWPFGCLGGWLEKAVGLVNGSQLSAAASSHVHGSTD